MLGGGQRVVYEQYGYEDRPGEPGSRSQPVSSEFKYQWPEKVSRGDSKSYTSGGGSEFDIWHRTGVEKSTVPRIKMRGPEKVEPTGKKDDLRLLERGDGPTGSANIDTQIMDRINKPKGDISFGDAFKGARGAGKSEFEWKGKKYHTRRADESKEDWQKKFKTKITN